MSEHSHEQTVPRGALIGASVLIVLTLSLAASARHERPNTPLIQSTARASMEVRFEDRTDGALAAIDAKTGRVVLVMPPGSNNFVRGVLRGMFRSRKLESLGHDGAFRLAQEDDGSLTLTDGQTSRRVALGSFGPTNEESFAQILIAGRKVQ